MSAPQNFRSAFNGFNREDVVRYLEYLNTKHTTQVNQLNSENDFLRTKLSAIQPDAENAQERQTLLDHIAELENRCAELEQQLAQAPAAAVTAVEAPKISNASEELEAYRRAERTERVARERAELVYHQANGVLDEATSKVSGAADQIGSMADQVLGQLHQLQEAVFCSKEALREAVATMQSLKPDNNG